LALGAASSASTASADRPHRITARRLLPGRIQTASHGVFQDRGDGATGAGGPCLYLAVEIVVYANCVAHVRILAFQPGIKMLTMITAWLAG
jgi:hypothetical protein